MATAIEQLKKELASAKASSRNKSERARRTEQMLVRKGSLLGTSALYGTLNRLAVPIDIGGFPWKLGVGAVALLAEGMSKGTAQSIFGGVADSTLAIYVERSISTGTVIAGDDDYDPDDDDDDDDDSGDGGEL